MAIFVAIFPFLKAVDRLFLRSQHFFPFMHGALFRIHALIRKRHKPFEPAFTDLIRVGVSDGNADLFTFQISVKTLDPVFDIFFVAITQDSGKFIPAEAVAVVKSAGTETLADAKSGGTQQLVARKVPLRVVDLFEEVYVKQHYGKRRIVVVDLQSVTLQAVTVGKPRKRVGLRRGTQDGLQFVSTAQKVVMRKH